MSSDSSKSCLRADTGDQHGICALLDRGFHYANGVYQLLHRSAEVRCSDDDQTTLQALLEEGAAEGKEHRETQGLSCAVVVHGPELYRELPRARLAVADQLPRPRVEVLFRVSGAFTERRWHGRVQNLDAAAGSRT